MNREQFISWLDRPITKTDEEIINHLVYMINEFDSNVDQINEFTDKLNKIEKIIKSSAEDVEVLE